MRVAFFLPHPTAADAAAASSARRERIVDFTELHSKPRRRHDILIMLPERSLDAACEPQAVAFRPTGEMAEWLKAHAWKACLGETLTWVRIPLSPPELIRSRRSKQGETSCLSPVFLERAA